MSPLVLHRPNLFHVSLIKLVFCAQSVPASCTETFSWVLWFSAITLHMFLNKILTFWEQQASSGSFRLSWHKGSSVLWGVLVSFTSRQCYTAGLGGCRWKEPRRNPAKVAGPSALENDCSDKSWFPLFLMLYMAEDVAGLAESLPGMQSWQRACLACRAGRVLAPALHKTRYDHAPL